MWSNPKIVFWYQMTLHTETKKHKQLNQQWSKAYETSLQSLSIRHGTPCILEWCSIQGGTVDEILHPQVLYLIVLTWHLRKMVTAHVLSEAIWLRNQEHAVVELSNCFVKSSTHWTMFNFSLAWMKLSKKKDVANFTASNVISSWPGIEKKCKKVEKGICLS